MVSRNLRESKYKSLQKDFIQNARNAPFCPIFEVDIAFNGEDYTLFLQLENPNKIYALYALHTVYEKEENSVRYELVLEKNMLAALTEIIVFQGAKKK